MKIEDIASLIMSAIEDQCAEGAVPREAMIETDDFSSVSLEGSFDIRAIAAHVATEVGKLRVYDCADPDAPPIVEGEVGTVRYDRQNGLTINIAPGALGKI